MDESTLSHKQPVGLRGWLDAGTNRLKQNQGRLFLVLALLIGALTGLIVVAFIVSTERLGMRLFPAEGAAWRRVLIPILGSLGMGYLLFKYFPEARGSGVPQTKAALFARDGVITARTALGKFFCTAATLSSGVPLGREGPSVQIGGGVASVLGRWLGLESEHVKSLIPVGAAAAIAAAFNTPLAAVLFALEEILDDLNAPVLGSVVIASATAWFVLRVLLGNHPLFRVPQYELVNAAEFAIYAVLGVVGGLVSALFTKLLLSAREWFLKLPASTGSFQPLAGGIVTGLMGWFVPQVLGVGYGYIGDALNERMALRLMALLVVFKLIATATSYASGNAGGIFGPSLFIGAMCGGTVGSLAHSLFPAHTATAGAYALVGMGAAFAGIVRAPMTSVMIIFEMTQDYQVIVPLMIANLISFFVSSRLQTDPIYEALAKQDGIHLPRRRVRRRQGERRVADEMRPPEDLLHSSLTLQQAIEWTRKSVSAALPVVDERGVIGVAAVPGLERLILTEGAATKLRDLLLPTTFPHLHADQPLSLALERMREENLEALPVVSRADMHRLLGVICLKDILSSFGMESVGAQPSGRDKTD